ncbi:hypothetical protein [Deferrisoma sp.]
MRTVNIHQAKTHLSRRLREAARVRPRCGSGVHAAIRAEGPGLGVRQGDQEPPEV